MRSRIAWVGRLLTRFCSKLLTEDEWFANHERPREPREHHDSPVVDRDSLREPSYQKSEQGQKGEFDKERGGPHKTP